MKSLDFNRRALRISATIALLTGCGGSQPPTGAPGAMPQSRASIGYNTLYSFGTSSYDAAKPQAGLIEVHGALYGTTLFGGASSCYAAGSNHGCGTVFSMSTTGTEKVLYSFQSGSDGANPAASLIDVKGVLYGTTEYGGYPSDSGCDAGTIFRISTHGAEKVLYRFYGYSCHGHVYNDGAYPVASLIDVKGRLYGTTSMGGPGRFYGTVFRVSTSGRKKILFKFDNYDGAAPYANLTNVNSTFYSTTYAGGANSAGTVFSLSMTGNEKVLHSFDGGFPAAGLINVKGTLYGTTLDSGAYNEGS